MKIARLVEAWYLKFARSFPWRANSTPWGRMVSEFMAQQTQIERVAQRWPQMMDRFPTPRAMARSDEQAVLSLWQGLGYYRRAKHLKATAEMIERECEGEVPSELAQLSKLPGVGKYTAGAIASIAFGKRVPIVDGNVHRVLCRLHNKSETPTPCPWSWAQATELVKECKDPSLFNEGLMELGATICTPRKPACGSCPLSELCSSYKSGTQDQLPTPRPPVKRKRLYHYAVVLTNNGEIAFEQRQDKGLWAGMWQVPTFESVSSVESQQVAEELDLQKKLLFLGTFKHVLTHRIVEFQVYTCEFDRDSRFTWHAKDSLEAIPLASAQRKVLAVHCGA
jgi:A/G-specific adenine glycosylase